MALHTLVPISLHKMTRQIPGATIRSKKHYNQPTLEENQPDKIWLHVGTSNLSPAKNTNEIASEVMELVDIWERLKIDIIVSEIVSRGDDLSVKGKAVNKCLKE